MYTISKEFHFSAAHHLYNLPEDHPCSRPHGHNYKVVLKLTSHGLSKDENWVYDYRKLDQFKTWLDTELDHRDLNEVLEIQTTAENLAFVFFLKAKEMFPMLTSVLVSETDKTWAEYSV